MIKTRQAHIGSQFPDAELEWIYYSLHTDLLWKVYYKRPSLMTEFCELGNVRYVGLGVMTDTLYAFAEKYDLLGIDTAGLE